MSISDKDITAVILAGGQGRRMGGQDKGLIEINGRILVAILIDRLEQRHPPQPIRYSRLVHALPASVCGYRR